jgi:integrase
MNQNHPTKGDQISVEPIRSIKDIQSIKKMLQGNPRDFALFVVGINTASRASDLLALTVGQVRHLNPGDTLPVRERKTSKVRRITLNAAAHAAIKALLDTMQDTADGAPLFQSRKGNKALTVSTLNNMVKAWCEGINLKGNYGSHTLRKTFGYHHRVTHGTDLPTS